MLTAHFQNGLPCTYLTCWVRQFERNKSKVKIYHERSSTLQRLAAGRERRRYRILYKRGRTLKWEFGLIQINIVSSIIYLATYVTRRGNITALRVGIAKGVTQEPMKHQMTYIAIRTACVSTRSRSRSKGVSNAVLLETKWGGIDTFVLFGGNVGFYPTFFLGGGRGEREEKRKHIKEGKVRCTPATIRTSLRSVRLLEQQRHFWKTDCKNEIVRIQMSI